MNNPTQNKPKAYFNSDAEPSSKSTIPDDPAEETKLDRLKQYNDADQDEPPTSEMSTVPFTEASQLTKDLSYPQNETARP